MRKVTLFCAATLFSLLSFAQDNNADIVKVGDSMPAFTLHSTVNGTVNSEDLKGKVVLINIFATWCGPCQSELAEVQKTLWPKYKDNKDFCMLVIGREHTDDQLTKYNKRKGFTFPDQRFLRFDAESQSSDSTGVVCHRFHNPADCWYQFYELQHGIDADAH